MTRNDVIQIFHGFPWLLQLPWRPNTLGQCS